MCIYGHGVVRGILEELDDHDLKGFEIWLPMMSGDDVEAAHRASDTFQDTRVSHIWDENRQLGTLVARTLTLKKKAWDTYLLYDRGILWEGDPLPKPSFWMAQLPSGSGIREASLLDPGRLAGEVHRLMGKENRRNPLDLKLHFHARGVLETMQKGQEFRVFMQEVESSS